MTSLQANIPDILFRVLEFLTLFCAIAAVTTRHILRSAIYLMGALCLSAGFYILLAAELLAGVQILVYVGGIVVLLVIAVMLTQNEAISHDVAVGPRKFLGLLVSLGFFVSSTYLLAQSNFAKNIQSIPALRTDESANSIKKIGLALLNPGAQGYILPFELISLLLLAVVVIGIVIARKEPT